MQITLIFIPCHMGTATVFADQISYFESRYKYHIANTFDHDSIADMAKEALANTHGPIIPIGLSMGGYIALEMVNIAPERIPGLVVMDSNAHSEKMSRQRERLAEKALLETGRYAGLTKAGARKMLSANSFQNTELVSKVIAMAKEPGFAVYEAQQKAIITRLDHTETLARLTCPALFMVGEEDNITPPQTHRRMVELTPLAELVEIAGAGHLITMEKPDEVNIHLDRFLNRMAI
jgi:pimeloyl-ACP methyl ester carboxylesterase